MGYYTHFQIQCTLKKDISESVVETIKGIVLDKDMPDCSVLSEEDYNHYRREIGGYDSEFLPHREMSYCEFLGWRIFVNGERKDYDDYREKFAEFLRPYVRRGLGVDDCFAMSFGEGQNEPTLYKLYEGNIY